MHPRFSNNAAGRTIKKRKKKERRREDFLKQGKNGNYTILSRPVGILFIRRGMQEKDHSLKKKGTPLKEGV